MTGLGAGAICSKASCASPDADSDCLGDNDAQSREEWEKRKKYRKKGLSVIGLSLATPFQTRHLQRSS
jgi:hypothetical protein